MLYRKNVYRSLVKLGRDAKDRDMIPLAVMYAQSALRLAEEINRDSKL